MKLSTGCLLTVVLSLAIQSSISSAQSPNTPCSDCTSGSQFGWGGSSARPSGHGGLAHSKAYEQHNLMFQRNQAWPKPFVCWDRTAYLNVWNQMYSSGLAEQCTLCEHHFDPTTGGLNRMGERKLQTVFQNHPEWQRGLLVVQSRDPQLNQVRLENVRNSVRQWYGDDVASQVAMTSVVPEPASGAKIQVINSSYTSSIPSPTINQSGSSNNATVGSTGAGSSGTGGGQ